MTKNPMTKAKREEVILTFLADVGIALPLRPLHWNLEREYNATWTQRTTKRRLEELSEEGLVRVIDEGNGYYEITEAGKQSLKNKS